MFEFFQPVWLFLLLPLAVAWRVWPLPSLWLRVLRAVTLVIIVFALAQLAIRLPDRSGTVIVVADRSESMPKNADASQKEIIDLLHKSMGPHDELGVVSFGGEAVVEQSPQRDEFGGFTAQVGPGHSDLNAGLETALSLIPPDGGGRILVISDGKWTGKDPVSAAARAAGRNIPIDYRLLERSQVSDVAIQSFLAPRSVLAGQGYMLSGWIRSPVDQEVQYQLRRGSTIIASGAKQVSAGLTRLMFRDRAEGATVYDYTLAIQGPKDDPLPENNEARALVSVEGSRPLLVLSSAGDGSGLVKLLRSGGVEVVGKTPLQCNWSLADLAQYSGVIIENVPAGQIGMSGMETLASWVENTGSGLLMTGGQKSYGPGGYFKSPLERIMPVSMEMRREHRKMSLAIVVALDRSGSMSMPAGGGRIKMDLADLGTVQVLDLLSPMDEFGVFAVDTEPHLIVPLDTVDNNLGSRGKILSIGSQGGGIVVCQALQAAAGMIANAKAQTKHIIMFADAADSRQQLCDYSTLIEKCREAGVTISCVGLGTEHDVDADILKDVAQRGGGQCYFSDSPDEIPRLFAQDTFTVARSTFVDQPTSFKFTSAYSSLGSLPSAAPDLGGYNLCYIRPEANLQAVTSDEYQAPVVSSWNAGNGRVLCFTGEADGKYSGALANWNQAGEFYATLARWTAGRHQPLPDDLLLTEDVRDGVCFVQLHLDPERKADPFSGLPRMKTLRGVAGLPPSKQDVPLEWKSADLLETTLSMEGRETVLNTVEVPGQQAVTLPPVCLPYSPEFAPDQPGRGAATLAQIAATSGGIERIEIPKMWSELQIKARYIELVPWLLVAAVILFLLEIFERRTGWISRLITRKPAVVPVKEEKTASVPSRAPEPALSRILRKRQQKTRSPAPATEETAVRAQPKPPESPAPQIPAKPSSPGSSLDAFREARERADRRTKRE
ncbi:MAG TPA: VWA domain-containing protein [Candidatus Angelobacter sp.]|nr:VWA domain-containing protein [Candidatus Angelobacter sp.]